MDEIRILEANLDLTLHSQAIIELTHGYAADPMGNGRPLAPEAAKNLIPGLAKRPATIVFLAFCNNKPVGLATCFEGFSTFTARPLIHISDLYLMPDFRGKTIAKRLLDTIKKKAHELNCCKITLEVQENNHRARHVYEAAGFDREVHGKEAGPALLFSQHLPDNETPA